MPGRHANTAMRAPTPPEIYNWRVYLTAVVASMGALLFGYDLAFIGTTITRDAFKKDFGLEDASEAANNAFDANIVSLLQAGCFFGSLFAGPLSDKVGRKWSIMISGMVFDIGSLMQTLAYGIKDVVYVGRVVGGLGVGACSMLVPMYIAEMAPPTIRGRLVGLYEIFVQIGTCVGFWVNYGIAEHGPYGTASWMTPFGLQLIPGGVLIIGMLFMSESPRYLARTQGREAAEAGLSALRNLEKDHPYLIEELGHVLDQIDQEQIFAVGKGLKATVNMVCRKGNWNRLVIGNVMMIFMQMAGSNAINYFSPKIFKSIGLGGGSTSLYATGIYGIIRLVAVLIAMYFVVDKLGRTKMLMSGSAVMAVGLWFVGAYVKVANPEESDNIGPAGYVAIAMLYIYAVGFCFSYAGIPWIYCSEIFPMNLRSIGVGSCTATHWLLNFVIARSVPYMITDIGYGTYFVFASFITVGIVWIYFFVPETKGLSLEDMDILFGSPQATSDVELGIAVDPEKRKNEIDSTHVEMSGASTAD
ncbi:general substrate transporter [Hortaea werneckii]|nr:general substrate transporter [Hortaea werneckii]